MGAEEVCVAAGISEGAGVVSIGAEEVVVVAGAGVDAMGA